MNKKILPKTWYVEDKKYKIVWRKPRDTKEIIKEGNTILGDCADPKTPAPKRSIRIDPNLDAESLVEICVHELIHAHLWALSEEKVTELGKDLTEFLFQVFDITKKG